MAPRAPADRTAPVVGAVLAGGAGRRIGGGKAALPLAGRPLISYPLASVATAGLEPLVAAKRDTELPALGCAVVRLEGSDQHPAAGILAALHAAAGRPIVAVACDMPFVPPGLLRLLAGHEAPVAVPVARGRLQPLAARYGPAAAPILETSLERGDSLRDAVTALEPATVTEREVARFGEVARTFFNVNTPGDLEAAERLLHAEPAPTGGPR